MRVMDSIPGPGWEKSIRRLNLAVLSAGRETFTPVLTAAKGQAAVDAPVYDSAPEGVVFHEPSRGQDKSGIRGKMFIRSVVATLAAQHPGLGIQQPAERALSDAIKASIVGEEVDADTLTMGVVSKAHLNQATHYNAKIILRVQEVNFLDRGPVPTTEGWPEPRPQLLWWHWGEREWHSASFVAYSSGLSVGGYFGGRRPQGPNPNMWRGEIEPGAGYWADVEFGTEGLQVDPQSIPGPGEDLVMLYLRRGMTHVARVPKSGRQGQAGKLFLTRAAEGVGNALYGYGKEQHERKFAALVAKEMTK